MMNKVIAISTAALLCCFAMFFSAQIEQVDLIAKNTPNTHTSIVPLSSSHRTDTTLDRF